MGTRLATYAAIVLALFAGISSGCTNSQESAAPTTSVAAGAYVPVTEDSGLEPGGIRFEEHIITRPDWPPQKVWIYLPDPLPSNSLPLVIVPPAGGTLFTAPDLGTAAPERLPYVREGFVVVSFDMVGSRSPEAGDFDILLAAMAFRQGRAGVDNARFALDFALEKLPIDPNRIYAAGHSSAATLVLLLAAVDRRIRGVAAYAPVTDVGAFLDWNVKQVLEEASPGYSAFLDWSSPNTHISDLTVPVFLFHSKEDRIAPYRKTREFAKALRQTNPSVKFVSVERGGHYDSMVNAGVPAGIAWMLSLTTK